MAYDPNYPSNPRTEVVQLTAANTSRAKTSSPTGIVTVLTAGAAGSRVDEIRINANETTTAGMIRMWMFDGTDYYCIQEVPVTPVTPSATLMSFMMILGSLGIILEAGYSLAMSTHNAETFTVCVTKAGDY